MEETTQIELDEFADYQAQDLADLLSDQDQDLTPKAEVKSWQDSKLPSESLQTALCLLLRLFKETGYFGDDDIYFAIYLRELTSINLTRKICEKFAINYEQVVGVLVIYQNGTSSRLNDEIVKTLRYEHTIEIELGIISQGEASSIADKLLMSIRI